MSITYTATATRACVGGDDERAVKMEQHTNVEAAPSLSRRSNNQEELHEEEQVKSRGRFAGASVATILASIVASAPPTAAVVTEKERAWRAAEAVARLFKRTKRTNETFADFAGALRDVGGDCGFGEELYVTAFIAGVGDEFTAALLRVVAPQSLASAAQEASRLRDTDGVQVSTPVKMNTRHQRERKRKQQHSVGGSPARVTSSKPVLLPDDASPRRVEKYVETVKLADAETDSLPKKKKKRLACFACEQLGHVRRECPRRAARLH